MVGGFIYFDTPIDTSVIEADISDLQSEMATKVTQGGDDTGAFPLEVGTKTAQPFVITTNLLARIRVLANGRTLVQKTTDTGEALQVGGTVQADTVNSPNIGTTTAEDAKFCANNAEGLRIFNATQNVAIGSALDTGHKLSVLGLANFRSGVRIAGTGSAPFTITQDTVSGVNSLLSIANSVASLRIGATVSEIALSTLSSDFRAVSAQGSFNIANSTTGGTLRIAHQSGETYFDSQQNNRLRFRTNAGGTTVELMRMENSGNILIGTTTDSANLILNVASTTKAVRFAPMTTAQRILIASPPEGAFLYDTDLKTYCFYDGTAWRKISHSLA